MLSHNDIHYLAGLLSWYSPNQDVDIELGSMVFDKAEGKERDVDITVKVKEPNRQTAAFRGIEVKDNRRKLDVSHIEQLCAKLNDMPEITHKAIVSASGYTNGARSKAKYHGVDLFNIIPWENPGFDYLSLSPDFKFTEHRTTWDGLPNVEFFIDEIDRPPPAAEQEYIRVCDGKGENITQKTMKELSSAIAAQAGNAAVELKSSLSLGEKKRLITDVNTEGIFIDYSGRLYPIKVARVTGTITAQEIKRDPIFKTLVRDGGNEPYTGCVVAEITGGGLMGLTLSKSETGIRLFHIPLSDRVKQKVFKQKITEI